MIIRDEDIQVTPNFKMRELYSTSFDAPSEHYLDDKVIQALQYIRTMSGAPIRVTSTYRTPLHNAAIGGSSQSQHLSARAIDFQWVNNNSYELTRLHTQINDPNNPLRENLYNLGVRGFGYYQTFCHIDTRPQGYWTMWGDDDAMIDQDGVTGYLWDETVPLVKKNVWLIVFLIATIVTSVILLRKRNK
jgi:hypothetical protein